MRRLIVNTIVLLLAAAAPLSAQGLTADEVMQRLRHKFEESGAWKADFRQALDTEFAETTDVVEGTIILSGEKYRIETSDQTVVTDGDTNWVYLAADNQVIINEHVDDDESFTPGHFLDERSERYDVAFANEQDSNDYIVNLTSTSPDTYIETATLWIDKSEFLVTRIDVVDVNGASIQFEMSNVSLITPTDSTFTFVPAEGVEIIDLR